MSTPLQWLKRWLDRHPRLRRRIVNTIYHIPALDLRLRGVLNQQRHGSAVLEADAQHLSASARTVQRRLRARMPRP